MSKFNDLMIDIETLGTGPYSVILSIAAVEFDITTGKTGKEFYSIIDPASCQLHGLKIDADTVLWWMGQSDEARGEFTKRKEKMLPLLRALRLLAKYLEDRKADVNIWANSPAFDCARIREAYSMCQIDAPWSYRQERDYRTILAQYPYSIPKKENRVQHRALDDCYSQIDRLVFVTDFILNRYHAIQKAKGGGAPDAIKG